MNLTRAMPRKKKGTGYIQNDVIYVTFKNTIKKNIDRLALEDGGGYNMGCPIYSARLWIHICLLFLCVYTHTRNTLFHLYEGFHKDVYSKQNSDLQFVTYHFYIPETSEPFVLLPLISQIAFLKEK